MSADPRDYPPHGPGCKPLESWSQRFAGERQYVCAANCPRKRALDRELCGLPAREPSRVDRDQSLLF